MGQMPTHTRSNVCARIYLYCRVLNYIGKVLVLLIFCLSLSLCLDTLYSWEGRREITNISGFSSSPFHSPRIKFREQSSVFLYCL